MSAIANTALSAALVAQIGTQNGAHNIANSKTDGFKRLEVHTSDLFYNNLKRAGFNENSESAKRPVSAQVGIGAKIDGIYRILENGSLKHTNSPLDVALQGPGYFAIASPNNGLGNNRTGYTRNGAFQIDPETRALTTINGEFINPDGQIIIEAGIDVNDISISSDGTVTAKNRANPGQADIELGKISVFTFPNERGLELGGNSILYESEASGEAEEVIDQKTKIVQKYLESSNVSAVNELMNMINYQRLYELALNFVKAESEMEKKLTEIS